MTDRNSGVLDVDDVFKVAPRFVGTFSSLLSVMEIQESKERSKLAKQASQQAIQISLSSKSTFAGRKLSPQNPITAGKFRRITWLRNGH